MCLYTVYIGGTEFRSANRLRIMYRNCVQKKVTLLQGVTKFGKICYTNIHVQPRFSCSSMERLSRKTNQPGLIYVNLTSFLAAQNTAAVAHENLAGKR